MLKKILLFILLTPSLGYSVDLVDFPIRQKEEIVKHFDLVLFESEKYGSFWLKLKEEDLKGFEKNKCRLIFNIMIFNGDQTFGLSLNEVDTSAVKNANFTINNYDLNKPFTLRFNIMNIPRECKKDKKYGYYKSGEYNFDNLKQFFDLYKTDP